MRLSRVYDTKCIEKPLKRSYTLLKVAKIARLSRVYGEFTYDNWQK